MRYSIVLPSDERLNHTLVKSLAKFAQGNREMWDEKLQEVIYAYNTAVQEFTKHTALEEMEELLTCQLISTPSVPMMLM